MCWVAAVPVVAGAAGGAAATGAAVGTAAAATAATTAAATGFGVMQTSAWLSTVGAASTAATTASAGFGFMQALQLGSLVMTGVKGIMGAKANESAAKQAQRTANINAAIADDQAKDAAVRGREAVSRQLRSAGTLRNKQKTMLAASGVELSGSPLQILEDTAMMSELDAQTISRNYQREAQGYTRESRNYTSSAKAYGKKARNERTSGLITTGRQVAQEWYRFK